MLPLTSRKVRVLLQAPDRHGFVIVPGRGKGSHRFLRHPDGRTTTVSGKPNDQIPRGLLAKILRDTGLSGDDLPR